MTDVPKEPKARRKPGPKPLKALAAMDLLSVMYARSDNADYRAMIRLMVQFRGALGTIAKLAEELDDARAGTTFDLFDVADTKRRNGTP